MVVYTVSEAFNDVPSEANPGALTVSTDVVPEDGHEGRKHVDVHQSTPQTHMDEPTHGDEVMTLWNESKCDNPLESMSLQSEGQKLNDDKRCSEPTEQ